MKTLWDLLTPKRQAPRPAPAARPARASVSRPAQRTTPPTMAERYERMQKDMLARYGVRVRKWRTSMSGVAWQVTYADGTVSRLIESPRPRGPVSASIFLHEIGHHAIGLGRYKPRCLEEYHAWMFSLAQMEAHGLNITEPVHRRVHDSLQYAVWKANRRGMKRIPPELLPYLDGPLVFAPSPPAPVAQVRPDQYPAPL